MKNLILIIFLLTSINCFAPALNTGDDRAETTDIIKEKTISYLKQVYKKDQFDKFLYKIALMESNNNWKAINRYGYKGKYQTGNDALNTLGYSSISSKEFKENPWIYNEQMQDKIIVEYMIFNEKLLKEEIKEYSGKIIDGIYITKSAILGASMFGAGNVKTFLYSNGETIFRDGNGTPITKYFKELNYFNF